MFGYYIKKQQIWEKGAMTRYSLNTGFIVIYERIMFVLFFSGYDLAEIPKSR